MGRGIIVNTVKTSMKRRCISLPILLILVFCDCMCIALRAAVQAFRREEELQFYRSSKRRRERFDQVCDLHNHALDFSDKIKFLSDFKCSIYKISKQLQK